jgi:PIN domain nuclease of toxin-antitoxin system
MKYLVDTHVLLWSLFEPNKLSKTAKSILVDPKNTIYVSSISFWEISIKYSLGKIQFKGVNPSSLPVTAVKMGFELLSLNPKVAASVHELSGNWHSDPFDRMLVGQALEQSLIMLSTDLKIALYSEEGLKVEW